MKEKKQGSVWLVQSDMGEWSDSFEEHHVFSTQQLAKSYCENAAKLQEAPRPVKWESYPQGPLVGVTSHAFEHRGKKDRITIRYFITELPYD